MESELYLKRAGPSNARVTQGKRYKAFNGHYIIDDLGETMKTAVGIKAHWQMEWIPVPNKVGKQTKAKEKVMGDSNEVVVEEVVLVDGCRADTMDANTLMSKIKLVKKTIQSYKDLEMESTYVANKIRKQEDCLFKLIQLLDTK